MATEVQPHASRAGVAHAHLPVHRHRGQHPPLGAAPGGDEAGARAPRRDPARRHRGLARPGREDDRRRLHGRLRLGRRRRLRLPRRAAGTCCDEPWGETGPLRVRMGLHAGEAAEREGDYFGPTLNRTARIMSAGHGGQVLLSAAAAALVVRPAARTAPRCRTWASTSSRASAAPSASSSSPIPALPGQLPAAGHSHAPPQPGLPDQPSAFVGRDAELAEIADRLADDSRAAAHADRPRRHRQDAAGAPRRGRRARPVRGRRLLRRPRRGPRQRGGARRDRERDRLRGHRGRVAARRARGPAAGRARPADPRQLRAGDRGGPDGCAPLAGLRTAQGARDQPRGAACERRAPLRGPAALAARGRAGPTLRRGARRLRGDPALRRARPGGEARLPAHGRQRRGRRRDLRATGRPAAGARARHRAHQSLFAGGPARAPRLEPPAAEERPPGPAGAPADPPRRDRVELRAARARRAAALRAAGRLLRRDLRRRRSRRRDPERPRSISTPSTASPRSSTRASCARPARTATPGS